MHKYCTNYFKEPLYLNSIYLILTTIVGTGSGFFFWIITAKYYSAEDIGFSVAVISSIGLLSLFSRFGLEIGIISYLPIEREKNSMINSCLAIISLTSIAMAVVYLLELETFSPKLLFLKEDTFLMFSFILFTIFYSLYTFQNNVFIALRDTKYSLFQNTVAISKLAILPVFISMNFLGIYVSWGFGFIISVICGNVFISKMIPNYELHFQKRNSVIKEMIRFSLGNYLATIFEAMPNFLYPLLVVHFLGAEMNAYFYIAWSFSAILFIIPKAISTSLFAEGSHSTKELNENLIKSVKFIIVLLIPSILIIFYFGDKILSGFGDDYSKNAFEMLNILAISAIPYSFNMVLVSIKRIRKDVISVIYIHAALMILSLILSSIFVKEIGLNGVAFGWLVANLTVNGIIALLLIRRKKIFARS
jgi:O-antigen/teichoic acid export membrane protein